MWFGRFASGPALLEYLRGPFAEDMGQDEIDHEFVEASWHEVPTADARELLRDHTASGAYAEAVAAAWSAGFAANAVVLVFSGRVEHPRSVQAEDQLLQHVGTFAPADPAWTSPTAES